MEPTDKKGKELIERLIEIIQSLQQIKQKKRLQENEPRFNNMQVNTKRLNIRVTEIPDRKESAVQKCFKK